MRVTSDFLFDWQGKPISIDEWSTLVRTNRVLAQDVVPGPRLLKTVYLGFVDPAIPDTALFGSALLDGQGRFLAELALYDSRDSAARGHTRLVKELHEKPEERP